MKERQFPILPGLRLAETPTIQTIVEQRDGKAGIAQTLGYMERLKNDYKINPVVRGLALSLVAKLPQKDYDGEVRAVTEYVKDRVRYVRDIAGVETLQTPLKTLEYGQGDCDDKSTLLAAMLESLGHHCRFRAVGFSSGSLCHVFVEVRNRGRWLPLETTEPVAVGWEPPGVVENMYSSDGNGELDGLFSSATKKLKRKLTHPFANPIEELKRDIKEDAHDLTHAPVVSKVMNKVVKIKGLSTIIKVVGWVYPPAALICQVIGYAISLYQAAQALEASIKMAQAAKQLKLEDGRSLAQAQSELAQLQSQYTAAINQVGGPERVDSFVNLVLVSGVSVLGVSGVLLYRMSHVSR